MSSVHSYLAVLRGRPIKVVASNPSAARKAAARHFHLRNTSRMSLAAISLAYVARVQR